MLLSILISSLVNVSLIVRLLCAGVSAPSPSRPPRRPPQRGNQEGGGARRVALAMTASDAPAAQTPLAERLEPAPSTFEQCIRQAQVVSFFRAVDVSYLSRVLWSRNESA